MKLIFLALTYSIAILLFSIDKYIVSSSIVIIFVHGYLFSSVYNSVRLSFSIPCFFSLLRHEKFKLIASSVLLLFIFLAVTTCLFSYNSRLSLNTLIAGLFGVSNFYLFFLKVNPLLPSTISNVFSFFWLINIAQQLSLLLILSSLLSSRLNLLHFAALGLLFHIFLTIFPSSAQVIYLPITFVFPFCLGFYSYQNNFNYFINSKRMLSFQFFFISSFFILFLWVHLASSYEYLAHFILAPLLLLSVSGLQKVCPFECITINGLCRKTFLIMSVYPFSCSIVFIFFGFSSTTFWFSFLCSVALVILLQFIYSKITIGFSELLSAFMLLIPLFGFLVLYFKQDQLFTGQRYLKWGSLPNSNIGTHCYTTGAPSDIHTKLKKCTDTSSLELKSYFANIFLIGDSYARHHVKLLQVLGRELNSNISFLRCDNITIPPTPDFKVINKNSFSCGYQVMNFISRTANSLSSPSLVIVSSNFLKFSILRDAKSANTLSSYNLMEQPFDNLLTSRQVTHIASDILNFARRLSASGSRLVLMGPIPQFPPYQILTATDRHFHCSPQWFNSLSTQSPPCSDLSFYRHSTTTSSYVPALTNFNNIINKELGNTLNFLLFDQFKFLCDTDLPYCSPEDHQYISNDHLSVSSSKDLAYVLLNDLASLGWLEN